VLILSLEKGLTFYDAAYIFQSQKLNLPLLTNDRKMASAGKKAGITVKKAEEIA
jgi:predicted nucleic acid-binding protein